LSKLIQPLPWSASPGGPSAPGHLSPRVRAQIGAFATPRRWQPLWLTHSVPHSDLRPCQVSKSPCVAYVKRPAEGRPHDSSRLIHSPPEGAKKRADDPIPRQISVPQSVSASQGAAEGRARGGSRLTHGQPEGAKKTGDDRIPCQICVAQSVRTAEAVSRGRSPQWLAADSWPVQRAEEGRGRPGSLSDFGAGIGIYYAGVSRGTSLWRLAADPWPARRAEEDRAMKGEEHLLSATCYGLKQCVAVITVIALLLAQTPLRVAWAQQGRQPERPGASGEGYTGRNAYRSSRRNGDRGLGQPSTRPDRDRIDALLASTHEEIKWHIVAALSDIRREFKEARWRSRRFAESVLTWRWKWRCIKAYVTGNKAQFQRELMWEFERRVISARDIQRAVRAAVARALSKIQEEEDRLLIDLRADTDLPVAPQLSQVSIQDLRDRYAQAMRQVASDARSHIAKDLRNEAIITAVIFMIENQVQRALTTLGIISIGGLGISWWTFGLSIVLALLVDWAYSKIYDPAGRLAAAVNRTLSRCEATVVREVHKRLLRFENARHELRSRAIRQVLEELEQADP